MTNLHLSAEEMKLVMNSDWILTKHRIIDKVYHLFGNLSSAMQAYQDLHPDFLSPEVWQFAPKISKGERYKNLPYVVLDYPRFFSKEDVLAIRAFFWWGNYFTITLHLKGKYLRQRSSNIAGAITDNKLDDFYFSVAGEEFSFQLNGGDYITANQLKQLPGKLQDHVFLKISYSISFEHWDTAEQKLMEVFERLMNI